MTTLQARNPWLINKQVDLGLILGFGVVLSGLLFVAARYGIGFLAIAVVFAMVADMPHVLQTHLRVLLDPEETRLHARPFYLSLIGISALVTACATMGLQWMLVAVWVYWQPYHVIKQHDGVMQIYAAKHGYRGSRSLARIVLFAGCAAPVLCRMSRGHYGFGEYTVFGTRMPFSGVELWVPRLPQAALVALYVVAAAATAMLIARQVRAHSDHERIPGAALATLAVAVCSYNIAYFAVDDLWATILIATSVHSLQYHVLCWLRNNRRFEQQLAPNAARREKLLSALSQRNALLRYAGVLMLLGAACMATETIALGVIPLTLVLHHFFLDGIVWKRARNPGLGRLLGTSSSGATSNLIRQAP
jgi:hypothetical protein